MLSIDAGFRNYNLASRDRLRSESHPGIALIEEHIAHVVHLLFENYDPSWEKHSLEKSRNSLQTGGWRGTHFMLRCDRIPGMLT